MDYSKCVGRVGALAVALGVGSAIIASPGVAVAQPGTDSESGHRKLRQEKKPDGEPLAAAPSTASVHLLTGVLTTALAPFAGQLPGDVPPPPLSASLCEHGQGSVAA